MLDSTILARYCNEGGIGKSIPDAQEISRDLRDFPRAKTEGNLEGRGKYLPRFDGAWIHYLTV